MSCGKVVAALLALSAHAFGAGVDDRALRVDGAECRWQPVEAVGVGAYSIDDQQGNPETPSEIILTGIVTANAEVTLELRMSGWGLAVGNPVLGTYQATVDGEIGYSSGDGADLSPKGGCCPGDPASGFIDIAHPDWVFGGLEFPCLGLPGTNILYINYELGASILGGCSVPDDGSVHYGATLVLTVPTNAAGTYTIDFVEAQTKTFMNDPFGIKITPLIRTPVRITIPTGRCCYNLDLDPQCVAGVTETECAETYAQSANPDDYYFVPGETCTAGNDCTLCELNTDCGDFNECTDDTCDPTFQLCLHSPNYDETLECCNPVTGVATLIDDGEECTEDICDPGTGEVTHNPLTGTSCTHVDGCVINDVCTAGTCTGNLPWDGVSGIQIACSNDGDCPDPWYCDTVTRVDGYCDCAPPCTSFTDYFDVFPPDCAIDARQPHLVDDANKTEGWEELVFTYDCDPEALGLTISDFQRFTDPPELAPAITGVSVDRGERTVTVELSRKISTEKWTCITHPASAGQWCMGYLPGNADQNRFSNTADLDALIGSIDGTGTVRPEYATDANRSGLSNAQDILRLIDLHNGAGEFAAWLNTSLPSCP